MAYPFSISLGVDWNLWNGRKGRRAVEYKENRHITIFGPTGSGKGVSLENRQPPAARQSSSRGAAVDHLD